MCAATKLLFHVLKDLLLSFVFMLEKALSKEADILVFVKPNINEG